MVTEVICLSFLLSHGASEAHLLVDEITRADVGVIVLFRAQPLTWDARRVVTGAPLKKSDKNNSSLECRRGVCLRSDLVFFET